jgi:hypothetical protein
VESCRPRRSAPAGYAYAIPDLTPPPEPAPGRPVALSSPGLPHSRRRSVPLSTDPQVRDSSAAPGKRHHVVTVGSVSEARPATANGRKVAEGLSQLEDSKLFRSRRASPPSHAPRSAARAVLGYKEMLARKTCVGEDWLALQSVES